MQGRGLQTTVSSMAKRNHNVYHVVQLYVFTTKLSHAVNNVRAHKNVNTVEKWNCASSVMVQGSVSIGNKKTDACFARILNSANT